MPAIFGAISYESRIGAARERAELAEDRRLLHERDAERQHVAVVEQDAAVLLLLVVVRRFLRRRIVEALLIAAESAEQLDAAIAVERIDRERGAALHRARRGGEIAIDELAQVRIVEDAFELAVIELRPVVAREGPLQTLLHVLPRERHACGTATPTR
jgi:hypothetical protein